MAAETISHIAAHRAWRQQLELLLASTGEGIYGVDLDGRCVFINRAGADMLGYQPEQVIGCNMHDLMHHTRADGSHYPSEQCPIYQAFRQGEPCRLDSDVLWRADGTSFYAEYSSYPIRDRDRITGAVVTFVDISDLMAEWEQAFECFAIGRGETHANDAITEAKIADDAFSSEHFATGALTADAIAADAITAARSLLAAIDDLEHPEPVSVPPAPAEDDSSS